MGLLNDDIDVHEYNWFNTVTTIILIILISIVSYMYFNKKHDWKTIYEDDNTKIERCEDCGMERYHNLIEE